MPFRGSTQGIFAAPSQPTTFLLRSLFFSAHSNQALRQSSHILEALQSPDGNFVVGRSSRSVLQFAGKGVLDALLSRTSRDLLPSDLNKTGNREDAGTLAADVLLDLGRQGLEDAGHVLLCQIGGSGD